MIDLVAFFLQLDFYADPTMVVLVFFLQMNFYSCCPTKKISYSFPTWVFDRVFLLCCFLSE